MAAELTTMSMLTTKDNPFNPFDQWDEWYNYDVTHGGWACRMLGRFASISDGLSNAENSEVINQAIDEIIAYDFENKYSKVTKDVETIYV